MAKQSTIRTCDPHSISKKIEKIEEINNIGNYLKLNQTVLNIIDKILQITSILIIITIDIKTLLTCK